MFNDFLANLNSGANSGLATVATVDELRKALTSGYATDVSTLSGGSALRIQSLDRTMQAIIQTNENFRLFNALSKMSAGGPVDEWTEQTSVGGFPGGSTNTETGVINPFTGTYNRRVGFVKYLMTMRQVSLVVSITDNTVDAEAIEVMNGALQLLSDAEYLCFEGDSDIVPTEFDGLYKLISGLGSEYVIDLRGAALNGVDSVFHAAELISGYGNFGRPTDIYVSQAVQKDFDTDVDAAYRVNLPDIRGVSGIELGAPVGAIKTSWGLVKVNPDVFIRDEKYLQPFEVNYSSVASANTFAPQSVTTAVASDAASQFDANWDGNYYYAVAGINEKGQSVVTKTSQQAIAVGEKCTLTITASSGGTETGYVVYRSRLGGTNATADFRYLGKVAKAGATTPFVDYNEDIPNTTKAYVCNMDPNYHSISWKSLLPMFRFDLYPTNAAIKPWAQMMFGYLRVTKRQHFVVIKNILPSGYTWNPKG